MTTIVALVKQVPDTYSTRQLTDDDFTLDRAGADAVIDEINQNTVEAALQLKEQLGDATVTVVSMGPERATEAVRKALSMGADDAILLTDDALHGSDAVQTGWALHNVLETIEGGADIIVAGNASTDGATGAVPQIIGVYGQRPVVSNLREIEVADGAIVGTREDEDGTYKLRAALPAIITVNEKANSPRFPSFKGIQAAKKKTIVQLSLADLAEQGMSADQVGLANAATAVHSNTPKPPKEAGVQVKDEGDGGTQLVQYLREQKFI
ncbi:electron transfer flavoprotein subunit beta/FixA family protein [Corynebacterium ulceribovis]|uniref:electron transfer flavoprotein subunit beta/FixA family protein n=1 Tax=Corynebacterium ulceribovis TaxID=487732 RepID=UPI00037C2337|nr:electron transfer flavoprotein subunit beta/FixA family protein [Corynebacterium ulceribovis]